MIRVGIVDEDPTFMSRLKEFFEREYPGEFEFIYFTNFKKAKTAADRISFDVLLLNKADESMLNSIPKQCKVAIFHENVTAANTSSIPTVGKYQSVDDWYSFLVGFCKEESNTVKGGELDDSKPLGKLCLFSSTGGGVGASTVAAAFCLCCASRDLSVVYLNFETLSSTERFFTTSTKYGFDDVVYALRSKKYELKPILKRAIIRDCNGIGFIKPCKIVPDFFSVTGEEIIKIVDEIRDLNEYEVIVVDMNFESTENIVIPFLRAHRAVFVTDGTEVANLKFSKILSSLALICEMRQDQVIEKIRLLYNKFEIRTGTNYKNAEIGQLGGINVLEYSSDIELIREISTKLPIRKLLREFNI